MIFLIIATVTRNNISTKVHCDTPDVLFDRCWLDGFHKFSENSNDWDIFCHIVNTTVSTTNDMLIFTDDYNPVLAYCK